MESFVDMSKSTGKAHFRVRTEIIEAKLYVPFVRIHLVLYYEIMSNNTLLEISNRITDIASSLGLLVSSAIT